MRYTSDKGVREFTPLDFMAELSVQIPDTFEQTVRFCGVYSARSRGKQKREKSADNKEIQATPTTLTLSPTEPPTKRAASRSWARLIKKVYEVDPLLCPKCGSTMKIKSFVTKHSEIARLIENLKLPNFHPPPPFISARKADPHYWDAA